MQRIGWMAMFFVACFCGSAHGQTAHAGCMQGPNCGVQGSGSGSSNGSPKPASTPQNRTAAAMNSMQNNLQSTTQMINNAGTAILNALQPNNDSNTDTIPASNTDSGIQPVSYMDSASATNGGAPGSSSNTAAAVNSLLDPGLSPSSSNSAINSLLGDSTQPGATATTPAGAIANLLDINKVSDSASVFPAYVPLDPPSNPQFAAMWQETVNQPDPSASTSLLQSLQGAGQQVEDQLTGLVSSSRALASSALDNRFVQWATSDKGNFTTVPLPVPSDSPNTANGLVDAQAVVGFGTILKQCVQNGPTGCAKGIKEYGTAMVNQMGADLGYAQVNIVQNPNADPNN
jgi:hypothetical protein